MAEDKKAIESDNSSEDISALNGENAKKSEDEDNTESLKSSRGRGRPPGKKVKKNQLPAEVGTRRGPARGSSKKEAAPVSGDDKAVTGRAKEKALLDPHKNFKSRKSTLLDDGNADNSQKDAEADSAKRGRGKANAVVKPKSGRSKKVESDGDEDSENDVEEVPVSKSTKEKGSSPVIEVIAKKGRGRSNNSSDSAAVKRKAADSSDDKRGKGKPASKKVGVAAKATSGGKKGRPKPVDSSNDEDENGEDDESDKLGEDEIEEIVA